MKAAQSTLLNILGSPRLKLIIPAYQRRYSWQERQCEELWLDIHRAGRRSAVHFSGTVLYEELEGDPDGNRWISIVDGQQRMTTITLMLVALRNYLRAHPADHADVPSPENIDSLYLTLPLHAGAPQHCAVPKLCLSRLDYASLESIICADAKEDVLSRNVKRNLEYFETLMSEPEFDPRLFMRGLANLHVVMAKLDHDDNAQAVFESLNSKGMQLNIGDMVRNYLLASETHEEQTRLYIEYWTVIEGVFDPDPGSLKLDTMIKAWLSVRFTKVRARTPEDVYSAFKRYYDDEYASDLEPVLNELRSFSMVWAENYRYHAVKKFRSMPWATNGAQTLTSGYKLKKAENEEYAERVRQELRAMGREL